ncbi:MAG: decaprenyl-phosphate phosphoribosyltransferase [Anaerolineales bacterium]|jgi:4-hydroxybenzoate polyprenyltransferase
MLRALIISMRPRQWAKNLFIFAAIVFDQKLSNPTALFVTISGFVIFCLLSSSVYLINDIGDVEADRSHPKKRNRPIASGALPIRVAWMVVVLLLALLFPLAFLLSPGFGWIALLYFLLNLAYTKWLKHIPIIDVLVLASFYLIRIVAGVSLITVERFSPWLYVVTGLLALFIGLGKRRAELALLADDANTTRKVLDGYTLPFLDQLILIVSSATIMSYSLYTFSAPNLPSNHTMMLTIPMVLYGLFRYLHLIQVDQRVGSPEDLLFTDRPLQMTIVIWVAAVIGVLYVFPLA